MEGADDEQETENDPVDANQPRPGSAFHDDAHGAFMTLPPYTRIREGETRQLEGVVPNSDKVGLGVRKCPQVSLLPKLQPFFPQEGMASVTVVEDRDRHPKAWIKGDIIFSLLASRLSAEH